MGAEGADPASSRSVVDLTAVAAIGCLLWLAPLVTDWDALANGSLLGTKLGAVLFAAWIGGVAPWGGTREPRARPLR